MTILLLVRAVAGLPLRYEWKPSSPLLLQRVAMSSKPKAAAAPALISVKADRIRTLSSVKSVKPSEGGVVYWMSRDQRVQDNWALLHARQLADEHGVGLSVAFCMVPGFLGATIRHYGFMLKGLAEVEAELRELGIPFTLLQGEPGAALPDFVRRHKVAAVVSDFSPLRVNRGWKDELVKALPDTPHYEVDAHNVVPVWVASDKKEVGARTIRKKITERLPEYLTDFPPLPAAPAPHPSASLRAECAKPVDWAAVDASLTVDRSVAEVDWCVPGAKAGLAATEEFCASRLRLFAEKRNDPNVHACSDLSPYTHFGQIAPQRAALLVKAHYSKHGEGVKSYLEEAIVRRELSDNFCYYEPNYDNLQGAAGWARDSLELHASDPREHVYSLEQLEASQTHEDIWNAAQTQLVKTGKMHGFMRMYWAKKVLEWSPDAAEALRRAILLNDKYSLDGRDPNGYVGCAWSIMGTHDMGWAERAIFGKIRFMNYAGCKRKFDLKTYVAKWGAGPASTQQPAKKKAKTS